jgi:hypothetical protein
MSLFLWEHLSSQSILLLYTFILNAVVLEVLTQSINQHFEMGGPGVQSMPGFVYWSSSHSAFRWRALHSMGIRNVFENRGSSKSLWCDFHTKHMRMKQSVFPPSAPRKLVCVSYVLPFNYIAVTRNKKLFILPCFLLSSQSGFARVRFV